MHRGDHRVVRGALHGRVPEGLHNFIAQYLRYTTHVFGYVYLLADPWPSFSPSEPYPIDARIDGPQPQGRLGVFFRCILAIPALILASVFRTVNQIIALLRLVLRPRDRTDEQGDARHQRVALPLRAADVRVHLPADRQVPEPVGRADALTELRDDLVGVGVASFGLLREDEGAVGDDVELGLLAGDRFGVVALRLEIGRETHGPRVVAASDGAVEDLDARHTATVVVPSVAMQTWFARVFGQNG